MRNTMNIYGPLMHHITQTSCTAPRLVHLNCGTKEVTLFNYSAVQLLRDYCYSRSSLCRLFAFIFNSHQVI